MQDQFSDHLRDAIQATKECPTDSFAAYDDVVALVNLCQTLYNRIVDLEKRLDGLVVK